MFRSFSGQAMIAKAHAMYGKRLKSENYHELVRLKSVGDIAAYLKNTPGYADTLANIYPESIHRGQLELLLRKSVFNKYVRLARYDTTSKNSFLFFLVSRLEIEQIMRSIMFLNANDERFIEELPGYLISHATFSLLELAKVRDFDGLLTVLEHTPYHDALAPMEPEDGKKIDYTGCEAALNTLYYEQILKKIDKTVKGKSREELKIILKTQVDLINLSIVFRLKCFFQMDDAEIRSHLLPFHYRLSKDRLDALLAAETKEDIFSFIRSTNSYRKTLDLSRFSYIEDYIKQINSFYSKHLMRFSSSAPAVVYGYMELLQIELMNITNIIEGIRYGLAAENILKLLIII